MCRSVERHLKPGGRFVTMNNNPFQRVETFTLTQKHGLVKSVAGELREGTPILITCLLPSGRSVSFEDYHLSPATHEQALQAAGLRKIEWHRPQVSPEGEKEFGREYWADFLDAEPFIGLECWK